MRESRSKIENITRKTFGSENFEGKILKRGSPSVQSSI